MKIIILILIVLLSLTKTSFPQIKITNATKQKTIAGTGGVYMNYAIDFSDKRNAVIELDSVKTIADASVIPFYSNKNGVSFQDVLLPPSKCKTCVETAPMQKNLTKGIIVYYRSNKKKSTFKVKKFQMLPDVLQP